MPPVRQTNFSSGELAPSLWGRTDLSRVAHGLRAMRNFFPTKQGAAVSRPGTQYLGEVKGSEGVSNVRLVPFIYSDEQSYVLEFGEGYIRFWTMGAQVLAPSPNLLLEYINNSGYPSFTQGQMLLGNTSGATATIVSVVENGSAGTLELEDITGTFVPELISDSGGATGEIDDATLVPAPDAPFEVETDYLAEEVDRIQWVQSGDVLTITHPSHPPMELRRLDATDWTFTEAALKPLEPYFRDVDSPYEATLEPYALDALPSSDATHPAREWIWKVTVVAQHTPTGVTFETLPATVHSSMPAANVSVPTSVPINTEAIVLYSDKSITLRRPLSGGLIAEPDGWDSFKAVAFNYYRGRGELFGFVGQTKTREFVDVGSEPDYAHRPPVGLNPFEIFDNVGVLERTEHPVSLAYFQERRVFAGTNERPGYLFFSATGDYANYDRNFPLVSGCALTYELACRRRECIRSLLPVGKLLVFTSASVWAFGGQQGEPLDFNTQDAKVVEEIGASFLPPLLVDGAALFARAKGQGIRAIVEANSPSGYRGIDISMVAQHLFLGEERTEVGDLLPLEADSTRAIVDWCYQEDPYGLVWAVRDDGVLLSLTFSQSDEMWAWARHDTDGEVLNVCSVPEGDEDAVYLVVQRGEGRVFVERMASRVRKGGPYDDAAVDCALRYEGPLPVSLDGLEHLEGETVWVLTYGEDPVSTTVTDGAVAVPEDWEAQFSDEGIPTIVIHVGLLFTPELETLDVASASARLKPKAVSAVGFEVEGTRGLKAGQDFDHLVEWRQRVVADDYSPITATTELFKMTVTGKWALHGRAVLRQTLPLPVTVVGLTREVANGE